MVPDCMRITVGSLLSCYNWLHMLTHPAVIRPADHAEWRSDKMGKSTIYESARLLFGLNAFERGQSHVLRAHAGTDKMYYLVDGEAFSCLKAGNCRCRRTISWSLPMECRMVSRTPAMDACSCWPSSLQRREPSTEDTQCLDPDVGCAENVKLRAREGLE